MRSVLRLALAVSIATSIASAARGDIAPPGWRPPPSAPAPEEEHVAVVRASLLAWMSDEEREALGSRTFPRCREHVYRPRSPRAAGFGGRCPSLEHAHALAIDRAARFFAAEVHAARGRGAEAEALRDLAPLRDPASRRAAAAQLARYRGEDTFRVAHELTERGPRWPLVRVATELGALIRHALDAGVPRDRLVAASIELVAALARPLPPPRARLEAISPAPPDRRYFVALANRAAECLQPAFQAQGRPVRVDIGLVTGASTILHVAAEPTLARCLEAAAERRAPHGAAAPAGAYVIRVRYGREGVLFGEPVALNEP